MPKEYTDLSYEQTKEVIHNLTNGESSLAEKTEASFSQSLSSPYRKESDIPSDKQRLEEKLYQPFDEDCN